MIQLEDVHKRFGPIKALDGLSLEVPPGRIFGLIGPNGAGKTTTIRILAGLLRPDKGTVRVNGVDLARPMEARRSLGALIEQPGLYGKLTLIEYLTFFAKLYDLDARQARSRIEELCELLDLDAGKQERLHGYSLGMKQKVALARILLHDPPLLLLDEPTAGLDPLITKKVRDYLLGGGNQGRKTILVSTHNLDEAARVCDEIAIIHQGRILEKGSWEELRMKHTAGGRVAVRLRRLDPSFGALLEQEGLVPKVMLDPATHTIRYTAEDYAGRNPAVIARLVKAGAEILSVELEDASLEQAYLRLVGESQPTGQTLDRKGRGSRR